MVTVSRKRVVDEEGFLRAERFQPLVVAKRRPTLVVHADEFAETVVSTIIAQSMSPAAPMAGSIIEPPTA